MQADLDRRQRIEEIFEAERKKSAVLKRCNRMYHQFLKRVDEDLYVHMINVKLDPELQMMRWLRCILSREFTPDETLVLWDYLFSGIDPFFINQTKYNNMYLKEDYHTSMSDPLIYLDLMSISMLVHIRD